MADSSYIDWRQGSKFLFDQASPYADFQPLAPVCRSVQQYSEWGRATNIGMGRSLVDPGLSEQARFKRLTNTDKLAVAIRGAVNSFPSEVKSKASDLLDPANLAIMAGALAIWVGAHATPIGWVVDIGMAGLGIYALGSEAIAVISEVKAFGSGVVNAEKESDLILAGKHLGKAIAIVGVDLVVAILLKRAVVKVREPRLKGGADAKSEQLLFGKYDPSRAQSKLPPEPVTPKPTSSSTVAPKTPPKRPTWKQSEEYVGKQIDGQGYSAQKSFKNGVEVPYGTKGSVRPEYYKAGTSVEVKNYNVETPAGRASLERNVVKQATQRTKDLPAGTTQKLTIDVRGQNVSRAQMNDVLTNIETKSGGAITRENISILR